MPKPARVTPPRRKASRGIVLFVSLALLLALTVGGLTAAQTTTLELRMARNQGDAALAFHAAEAGLRDAEAWLTANAADPPTLFRVDGNGLYAAVGYGGTAPWRQAEAWRGTNSAVAGAIPGLSVPPRYIVEWLTTFVDTGSAATPLPAATIDLFRVTARGAAPGSASATLQSTYGTARGGEVRAMTGRLSWADLGT